MFRILLRLVLATDFGNTPGIAGKLRKKLFVTHDSGRISPCLWRCCLLKTAAVDFPLASISMQVFQLAHIVALRLKRRPNLLADFENSFLALAPTSRRRHWRDRTSLLHHEQITSDAQIHVHMPASQKQLNLSLVSGAWVTEMQHRAIVVREFTAGRMSCEAVDRGKAVSACAPRRR